MTRLRGWSPRGQSLQAKVPHGHWKTLTFLAALQDCIGAGLPTLASRDLAENINTPDYVTRVADTPEAGKIAAASEKVLGRTKRK
jgi:hypothetical protein